MEDHGMGSNEEIDQPPAERRSKVPRQQRGGQRGGQQRGGRQQPRYVTIRGMKEKSKAADKEPLPIPRISAAMRRKFHLPDSAAKKLGTQQIILYDKMQAAGFQINSFTMTMPKWLFNYDEDQATLLSFEDIKEMMAGDLLNISIIQAYAL